MLIFKPKTTVVGGESDGGQIKLVGYACDVSEAVRIVMDMKSNKCTQAIRVTDVKSLGKADSPHFKTMIDSSKGNIKITLREDCDSVVIVGEQRNTVMDVKRQVYSLLDFTLEKQFKKVAVDKNLISGSNSVQLPFLTIYDLISPFDCDFEMDYNLHFICIRANSKQGDNQQKINSAVEAIEGKIAEIRSKIKVVSLEDNVLGKVLAKKGKIVSDIRKEFPKVRIDVDGQTNQVTITPAEDTEIAMEDAKKVEEEFERIIQENRIYSKVIEVRFRAVPSSHTRPILSHVKPHFIPMSLLINIQLYFVHTLLLT